MALPPLEWPTYTKDVQHQNGDGLKIEIERLGRNWLKQSTHPGEKLYLCGVCHHIGQKLAADLAPCIAYSFVLVVVLFHGRYQLMDLHLNKSLHSVHVEKVVAHKSWHVDCI